MSGPLGEGDPVLQEQYVGQLVLERSMSLEAFCIDRYPFPGEGRAWTSDPIDWSVVEAFEAEVSGYGRRLCTVAELLAAAAGPENWRYPYDRLAYREGKCEPSDLTPSSRIGSYPECESPTGVRDFMVRSTWALLDEQAGEDIRAFYDTDTGSLIPGGGYYAVWGAPRPRTPSLPPTTMACTSMVPAIRAMSTSRFARAPTSVVRLPKPTMPGQPSSMNSCAPDSGSGPCASEADSRCPP